MIRLDERQYSTVITKKYYKKVGFAEKHKRQEKYQKRAYITRRQERYKLLSAQAVLHFLQKINNKSSTILGILGEAAILTDKRDIVKLLV